MTKESTSTCSNLTHKVALVLTIVSIKHDCYVEEEALAPLAWP